MAFIHSDIVDDAELHSMWEEAGKQRDIYYEEVERINNRILKAIIAIKGQKFVNSLYAIINEDRCNEFAFALVKKPDGKCQKASYGLIKEIWINQWSVGTEGDSFNGYIYVNLKENLWLEMYFAI